MDARVWRVVDPDGCIEENVREGFSVRGCQSQPVYVRCITHQCGQGRLGLGVRPVELVQGPHQAREHGSLNEAVVYIPGSHLRCHAPNGA